MFLGRNPYVTYACERVDLRRIIQKYTVAYRECRVSKVKVAALSVGKSTLYFLPEKITDRVERRSVGGVARGRKLVSVAERRRA